jgi:hypothetical protein
LYDAKEYPLMPRNIFIRSLYYVKSTKSGLIVCDIRSLFVWWMNNKMGVCWGVRELINSFVGAFLMLLLWGVYIFTEPQCV